MRRFAFALAAVSTLLVTSAAQATPPSGMLLGIYAFPNWEGLRVTGMIPGYSADGRIFPNDLLLRVTADGVTFYETKNLWQIENAKDQIGPFRPAALEIFRPGHGLTYLWVEFQPVGGPVAYSQQGGPVRMQAKIMTETERPGARALFQGGRQQAVPNTGADAWGRQKRASNKGRYQYLTPYAGPSPRGPQHPTPNMGTDPQGHQHSTPNMGISPNQDVFSTSPSGSAPQTGLLSDPATLFGR